MPRPELKLPQLPPISKQRDLENFPWMLFEYHRDVQRVYAIWLPGEWVDGVWVEKKGGAARGELIASGIETEGQFVNTVTVYRRGMYRGSEGCEAERKFLAERLMKYKQRLPNQPKILT